MRQPQPQSPANQLATPESSARQATRRQFMAVAPFAGAAVLVACSPPPPPVVLSPPVTVIAPAAPPPAPATASAEPAAVPVSLPMVNEKTDAQAIALGYVANAAQVDKAKSPAYAAGSVCGNCQLFLGKAGDSAGPCPLYAGKAVAAAGWCNSWVKKA